MTLKQWLAEGKLKTHQTTLEEIQALLLLANRDIQNAAVKELSPEWRFSIAYNAILNLATIPLLVAGYRTNPAQGGHHFVTIWSMSETLGAQQDGRRRYFNACRTKRHTSTYDNISQISDDEANELIAEAIAFHQELLDWLTKSYPDFDHS